MQPGKYEHDILKALQKIANSLDKIEKKMPDIPMTMNEQREKLGLDQVKEYNTAEYGKEHPEWVEKVNKIANESKKDLVEVTRCKNCKYYISAEDMKNDEMYKNYKNNLGHDGICTCTDKWIDKNNFCSDGKEE